MARFIGHRDNSNIIITRRRLFAYAGAGALLAGAPATRPAFAGESELLESRRGAAPLKLHWNENSLGMSPKAVAAAQKIVAEAPNRYADDMADTLLAKLAARHALPAGQFMLGNGSTEILKTVVTMAANAGGTLLEPTPTFGAAQRYAKAEKMDCVTVPVNNDFTTNISALRAKANSLTGLVLINLCTPNNPTGTVCDKAEVANWIAGAPDNHLFLVDEAYADFAADTPAFESQMNMVRAGRENVIVARTFSKVYGMAGMRVGYAAAGPETTARLKPFASTYNLSAAGMAAAIAALDDEDFYQYSLQSNREAKAILLNALDTLGLAHIPSSTNFVLHRIGTPLADYQRRMKANGILVGRRMTAEDGWNRLSIGTPGEMQAFTATMMQFREKGWV